MDNGHVVSFQFSTCRSFHAGKPAQGAGDTGSPPAASGGSYAGSGLARTESGALVGRGNNRMIFGYCKLTCRLDNGFNKLFCSNRWGFGIHKAIGHGIA